MNPERVFGEHLTSEDVAAYVDQAVSAGERERIEAHLAGCDGCTAEVAAACKDVDPSVAPARWMRRPALLVAAGIAAVALVGSLILGSFRTGERLLRDAPAVEETGQSLVQVLIPAEGRALELDRVEFAWRAVHPDAAYNLTVTDEGGDVVWTGSSRDTAVALTSRIALAPGNAYFWYVDALLPDGRTMSSGVRTFTVAAPE